MEGPHLEQRVDEEAQPLRGRDPPRGGMGLCEKAQILQFGHQIAHHSGANAERTMEGELLGTDRFGGRDKLLDGSE